MAFDDGEHIVEVMSHAGGELANRFHFLRMPQLRLQVEPLGNVFDASFEIEHPAIGISNGPDIFLNGDERPVAPAQLRLNTADHRIATDQLLPTI